MENYIGSKIKVLRKKNKKTVATLCQDFSEKNHPVGAKTIYKWESGECIPDIYTLNILCRIFDISISYFVESKKSFQALNDSELEFLTMIRTDKDYKKIVTLITKKKKERDRCE